MKDIREQVTELTNQVLEFGRQMESDDSLAQGTNTLQLLQEATSIYNKKELYALVSGEVKAGKSSLINSILGEDICTVNGGVCTNTNTLIRYGKEEKITVYYSANDADGRELEPEIISRNDIAKYVSERANKNNKKNVRLIVVEIPNEHLKSGLVLIDTPGLGSLNPLHAATTFSMAPMADVIILVASAQSQLKESELSYIERLLECSKSKMVIHALTHSDQGNPQVILDKNKEHFSSISRFKEVEWQYCKVSNKNLQLYRQKRINDYSLTGFDMFFSSLKQVEDNVENIMAERQLERLLVALQQYGNMLNTLLQSFSSPEKMEEKRNQIERAKIRLSELEAEATTWKNQLSGEIAKVNTRIDAKIKDNYNAIKNSIEEKLLMDEYLKHPEQLGGVISSEIVKKSTELQEYLAEEFSSTYSWLKEISGLTLIQKDIDNFPNTPQKELSICDVSIDKVSIYRNSFLGNVFVYGTVGGVICSVIGGLLGTIIAPGPGTIVGSEIGAGIALAVGAIVGFIKGKERVNQEKRRKIMEQVSRILNDSQSGMITSVKQIVIDAQTALTNAFCKEIKNDNTRCANILKGLDSDSIKRKQVSELKNLCDKHQATLAVLYKSVKKK